MLQYSKPILYSAQVSPMNYLPLPMSKSESISSALDKYFKDPRIGCFTFPSQFIIISPTVVSFSTEEGETQTVNLDFVVTQNECFIYSNHQFKLYGIVNHIENPAHYVAYVKNVWHSTSNELAWHYCDDGKVTKVRRLKVPYPYLLFYQIEKITTTEKIMNKEKKRKRGKNKK